jgi:hypothetical protein
MMFEASGGVREPVRSVLVEYGVDMRVVNVGNDRRCLGYKQLRILGLLPEPQINADV